MWHRVDKTESFGYRKAFSPTETRGGLAKLASRTLLQIHPTIWCRPIENLRVAAMLPSERLPATVSGRKRSSWNREYERRVSTRSNWKGRDLVLSYWWSSRVSSYRCYIIIITLNVFGELTLLNLLLHWQGGDLIFSGYERFSRKLVDRRSANVVCEPLPSAPWDLQRHRRNLKQMDCEGLDRCHMCALYLACVSDYIHSCNLRAWQCGSGPAWPTFDISLSFTRAPAKIERQTNTRCMPCLLIWGFKLSTAGMTLQQYICKYMNMQHGAMRQCACRIRPINFADTVHTCSAWFAQHICISWLLLTQTLNTQTLTVFTHLTDASRHAIEMCGHELDYTATHISVFTSCC